MKYVTKEESIKALQEFVHKFADISDSEAEDMFDDGRDSGDEEQNRRYCNISSKINKLHNEVCGYKFDCIPEVACQRIWRNTWGNGESHLPEVKWNHAIDYANGLIEYLISDKKELVVVNVMQKAFFQPLRIEDLQRALTGEADKLWPYNRGKKDEDVYPAFSAPEYNDNGDCIRCGIEPVKDNRFALLEWENEDWGNQFYSVCKCYKEKPKSIEQAVKEWSPKYWDACKEDNDPTCRFLVVEYIYM